ncbi:hypothetical protein SESBI_44883 [Sesbania bispinosa]|nr:hypothetical protein SESBI_44883 [Sesbania bispinosa]
MNTAEPQTHCRQNRVFGTTRSINIPEKPVSIKSITKTKIAIPQPKPIRVTQLPNDITSTKTQSPKCHPKLNKKSDTFPPEAEKTQENDSAEPKTPVESSHSLWASTSSPLTFRLALESHAEPIRNLRTELRKYLLRHGYLSEQKEWREVAARYGLLKVESRTSGIDSSTKSSSICGKNESDMS